MKAPFSSCNNKPGLSPSGFAARKQQALVLLLAQQLADAQFRRADPQSSERLWQEVANLDIAAERITALLYGGHDVQDRATLLALDDAWLQEQTKAPLRRWSLQRLHLGAPRRPMRAAASRA
ncbi:MAG: hypothetical protein RLZZ255_995 [Cyanobacteriota bacterium]|jgi:hypothetical protein